MATFELPCAKFTFLLPLGKGAPVFVIFLFVKMRENWLRTSEKRIRRFLFSSETTWVVGINYHS